MQYIYRMAYIAIPQIVWYQDRWQGRLVDFGIVIGIDADLFTSKMECKHAMLHGFQFMMRLQVWKSPEATIDDVRQAFLLRNLRSREEEKVQYKKTMTCRYSNLLFFVLVSICKLFKHHFC